MKKITYHITAVLIGIAALGCSDKELDTDNIYGKNLNTFYQTPTDIDEAMSGVYNAIYTPNPMSFEPLVANLMSDMMLGGGGPDDKQAKDIDVFEDPLDDTYQDMWVQSYNGIARCNAIIDKAESTDFTIHFDSAQEAQDFKDQAVGEALFMRAFFYFRLAKFFGGVPLITEVGQAVDGPRNTYSETFAQIASDLKNAIEKMPTIAFPSIPTARYGHANKWVAEAYLGRVYLHYTGYMTNIENQPTSDLPLAEGGSLSSSDVAAYLKDCIDNSGHDLVPDFRNLWPYSYVNTSAGTTVLPWADNEGLEWVGQDGLSPTFGTGNPETMFVQRFSFGNWDWNNGAIYTNRLCLFTAIRDNSLIPFGQGWGMCPVRPSLWNSWDNSDPRKQGSILELGVADQGTAGYTPDNGDHETGLVNKKYISLQHEKVGGGNVTGMFHQMYNWSIEDMQLVHAQDFIFMRFADVLLMHSEITENADGMNRVRNRAGLAPVAYSLAALKEERLHELAFEGLRWFDLVRWGDVDTAFNYTENVRNSGSDATYTGTYRTETKGLISIPETEISLSNGVYNQNPGW